MPISSLFVMMCTTMPYTGYYSLAVLR